MAGMAKRPIEVPDLIGLTFADARLIGESAGLVVVGHAPDGSAVDQDSEGIVVEQTPAAPAVAVRGDVLDLRVGRGDGRAKDPEPRRPPPLLSTDLADLGDPDGDLELVPA
jgi:beta-lactam-binding protein with PASTA domain